MVPGLGVPVEGEGGGAVEVGVRRHPLHEAVAVVVHGLGGDEPFNRVGVVQDLQHEAQLELIKVVVHAQELKPAPGSRSVADWGP